MICLCELKLLQYHNLSQFPSLASHSVAKCAGLSQTLQRGCLTKNLKFIKVNRKVIPNANLSFIRIMKNQAKISGKPPKLLTLGNNKKTLFYTEVQISSSRAFHLNMVC